MCVGDVQREAAGHGRRGKVLDARPHACGKGQVVQSRGAMLVRRLEHVRTPFENEVVVGTQAADPDLMQTCASWGGRVFVDEIEA